MKAVSLLVAPAWVGDAVMSEPLLRRIAAADKCPVDVLAPPWVAPVFERMPGVGKVIPAPFAHGKLDLAGRWKTGRFLKAQGYSNAYVLPNSLKSALPDCLCRYYAPYRLYWRMPVWVIKPTPHAR